MQCSLYERQLSNGGGGGCLFTALLSCLKKDARNYNSAILLTPWELGDKFSSLYTL